MGVSVAPSETKHRNIEGLSWVITALMIVGEMAGAGIVAIPSATVQCTLYIGVGMIVMFALMSGYTGIQLGENWTTMQDKWPEYRAHVRNPYGEMGKRAVGPIFEYLVTGCVYATLFGGCCVFVLIGGENISAMLASLFGVHVNKCQLVFIICAALFPVTLLESPKHFWPVVVGGLIATVFAVVLLVIGSVNDAPACMPTAVYPAPTLDGIFVAFGVIMFAYGGHAAFPTLQHDMMKPYRFNRSVIVASVGVAILYSVVAIVGSLVYGDSIADSIIQSIQTEWIQITINLMITAHVLFTFTMLINPLNQQLEQVVNINRKFGWQRVGMRFVMMLAVLLVSEAVPNFLDIITLIGGSSTTMNTMIYPGIFHMYFNAQKRKGGVDERPTIREVIRSTSWVMLFVNATIILMGLLGGSITVVTAVKKLIWSTSFDRPCFLKLFDSAPILNITTTEVHCCGHLRNITINPTLYSCSSFIE